MNRRNLIKSLVGIPAATLVPGLSLAETKPSYHRIEFISGENCVGYSSYYLNRPDFFRKAIDRLMQLNHCEKPTHNGINVLRVKFEGISKEEVSKLATQTLPRGVFVGMNGFWASPLKENEFNLVLYVPRFDAYRRFDEKEVMDGLFKV